MIGNIKYFKQFINESVNKTDNIKNLIDVNNINWNFHLKHNLKLNSDFKDGYHINDMIDIFVDKISPLINNGKIILYRMIGLKNKSSLKKPYGIYWTFDKNKAEIIDDEDYKHETDKKTHKTYLLESTFKIEDINWTDTFDIYLINNFMESEIRVNELTEPLNIIINKI